MSKPEAQQSDSEDQLCSSQMQIQQESPQKPWHCHCCLFHSLKRIKLTDKYDNRAVKTVK